MSRGVGGFDTQLPASEDYDLYLRLARRYRVAVGSERIADYRRHSSNMSRDVTFMLSTTLGVLRRQRKHLDGNAQWQRAYNIGIRDWKSIYAEEQFYQTFVAARASGLKQFPLRATAGVFALAPATCVSITCRRTLQSLRSRAVPVLQWARNLGRRLGREG
jgi:hypothetical protein